MGGFCTAYYYLYQNDLSILSRLYKIEIAKLATIPLLDKVLNTNVPALNFIERIEDVEIKSKELINSRLPIRVSLILGKGKKWAGEIFVYIGKNANVQQGN